MQRTKSLAACVAVLIVGFAPTASARLPKSHTVIFSAHFFDPGARPTGLGPCSEEPADLHCSVKGDGIAYYRAPLSTTAFYFCNLYPDPLTLSLFNGECWEHHMGFLAGCGEGSFLAHYTDPRADSAGFDPAAGTVWGLTWLKWTIVPGSGTGAFAGARGSGTANAYFYPDLSNTGVLTGHITCHV
jgi:hypothetical protein